MNKTQIFSILSAAMLFAVLYFGFSTKPSKQKVVDKSRALQAESVDIAALKASAAASLDAAQAAEVSSLETALENAKNDTERLPLLKKLSAAWYRSKNLPLAASVAEQVAQLANADSSWSVAGASFYEALVANQDKPVRDYCAQHAVAAFESAASLKPDAVEHRVNLALVYAEQPPADNPMKAVLMLRELETKHPESPSVFNALGRLAIKTGQWEKAVARLERSFELDKNNPNTPCLLALAYQEQGNKDKAAEFARKCEKD
jgi:tetratricopeptide (TPR) repeat protein